MKIIREPSPMLARHAVDEIACILRTTAIGGEPAGEPLHALCTTLEYYLPQLLACDYPKWTEAGLDGIRVARARRTALTSLQLLGTAILMSDQTLTPLAAEFALTPSLDALEAYWVSVGEPGGGFLGISGPPCNSHRGDRLQDRIETRIESGEVHWVYTTHRGELPASALDGA